MYPSKKNFKNRKEPAARKWLSVLKFNQKYAKMKKIPHELESEEGVSMVMELVNKINADREMRQIIEAREKEARDIASMKNAAFKKGVSVGEARGEARGIKKGKAEARAEALEAQKQLIEKMRAKGMSPEQISELLEIPVSEI